MFAKIVVAGFLFPAPHILRYASNVRGYANIVFQTDLSGSCL